MKLASLAVLLLLSAATAQDRRIYADNKYVEEAGDVIGSRIEVTIEPGSIKGILRHWEGGPDPQEVGIHGTIRSTSIEFSSDRALAGYNSRLHFKGKITAAQIRGTMLWCDDCKPEKLVLRRRSKKSDYNPPYSR